VTKLGCRNGAATWAECSGGAVWSRRVSWGKPVFRLTASSQLADTVTLSRSVILVIEDLERMGTDARRARVTNQAADEVASVIEGM